MTRKNQELRQQITNLEEEVAHVKSRAREDKIFMEAKIEEVEEANMPGNPHADTLGLRMTGSLQADTHGINMKEIPCVRQN